jgi:hypothetical protein
MFSAPLLDIMDIAYKGIKRERLMFTLIMLFVCCAPKFKGLELGLGTGVFVITSLRFTSVSLKRWSDWVEPR